MGKYIEITMHWKNIGWDTFDGMTVLLKKWPLLIAFLFVYGLGAGVQSANADTTLTKLTCKQIGEYNDSRVVTIEQEFGWIISVSISGIGTAHFDDGHTTSFSSGDVWAFFGVINGDRIKYEDGYKLGVAIGNFDTHMTLNKYTGEMNLFFTTPFHHYQYYNCKKAPKGLF